MPSKYTDEIENSYYTWRVFYMSRKSKYSAEQKLAILNELTRSNISEVAKMYVVGKKTALYFLLCNDITSLHSFFDLS